MPGTLRHYNTSLELQKNLWSVQYCQSVLNGDIGTQEFGPLQRDGAHHITRLLRGIKRVVKMDSFYYPATKFMTTANELIE